MQKPGKTTIGEKFQAARYRPSGFDYMRIFLAVSITLMHSRLTSEGPQADFAMFEGPLRSFMRLRMPMFFALSGFLVAGSLERTKTLGMFLALRALRIYPVMIVHVVLTALILGPLVTTLPLASYFTDPLFYKYLLTITGWVHYALPGVFTHNPLPNSVNGQLWTIPFELLCYVTITAIAVLGMKKHRILGPTFVVAITLLYFGLTLVRHNGEIVSVTGAVNGSLLVATFVAGISFYFYRDKVPWNPVFGLGAIVSSVLLLGYIPNGDFFAPIPAAYTTVYLGLFNPSRKILRGADYSFGVFIYGFGIQQALVALFPIARLWYFNILLSMPPTVLVAAFSWHFVELPARKLRPWMMSVEDAYLRASQRSRRSPARAIP